MHSRGVQHSYNPPKRRGNWVFQSMHSRGVQQAAHATHQTVDMISIHALTRSATVCAPKTPRQKHYFNPCTHEECNIAVRLSNSSRPLISIHALTRSATGLVGVKALYKFVFQSMHSRGVQHKYATTGGLKRQFQSMHSRGVQRRFLEKISSNQLISGDNRPIICIFNKKSNIIVFIFSPNYHLKVFFKCEFPSEFMDA